MTSSFRGNPDLKTLMLNRFTRYRDAGRVARVPLAWNGEQGSSVGCAIESADLTLWTGELALPRCLAVLIDAIAYAHPGKAAAAEAGHELLRAIPVDADLTHAGSAFIISLIQTQDARRHAWPRDSVPRRTLDLIAGLHRSILAGEQVTAGAWRAARKNALGVTDGLAEDSEEKLWAGVVEAAAWDPATSPTAPAETVLQWSLARRAQAVAEFGWTDADTANYQEQLRAMEQRRAQEGPVHQRAIADHMAEACPELHARIGRKVETEMESFRDSAATALAILLTVLRGQG